MPPGCEPPNGLDRGLDTVRLQPAALIPSMWCTPAGELLANTNKADSCKLQHLPAYEHCHMPGTCRCTQAQAQPRCTPTTLVPCPSTKQQEDTIWTSQLRQGVGASAQPPPLVANHVRSNATNDWLHNPGCNLNPLTKPRHSTLRLAPLRLGSVQPERDS
jgi:hypothetical protein